MSEEQVSVLVCRGCCCGTEVKHPSVDHKAQLATFRERLTGSGAKVFDVDCLGPCERSNVVVIRRGETKRWFGGILAPDMTEALADWAVSGATGDEPLEVAGREFTPDHTHD